MSATTKLTQLQLFDEMMGLSLKADGVVVYMAGKVLAHPSTDSPVETRTPETLQLRTATRLFGLLVADQELQSILGDLGEGYHSKNRKEGHDEARIWLWKQIFKSLPPLAWACLKRVSGLEALYRGIGR
jgi:hypothetical protein